MSSRPNSLGGSGPSRFRLTLRRQTASLRNFQERLAPLRRSFPALPGSLYGEALVETLSSALQRSLPSQPQAAPGEPYAAEREALALPLAGSASPRTHPPQLETGPWNRLPTKANHDPFEGSPPDTALRPAWSPASSDRRSDPTAGEMISQRAQALLGRAAHPQPATITQQNSAEVEFQPEGSNGRFAGAAFTGPNQLPGPAAPPAGTTARMSEAEMASRLLDFVSGGSPEQSPDGVLPFEIPIIETPYHFENFAPPAWVAPESLHELGERVAAILQEQAWMHGIETP